MKRAAGSRNPAGERQRAGGRTGRPGDRSARRAAPRVGFTLIEVIFAFSIAALLMTTILASIEMYRRVSTAGQREVAEAQLARAIFRLIELDLRSVAFVPPPGRTTYLPEAADDPAASGTGTGDTGTTGTTGSTETTDETAPEEGTLDTTAVLASGQVGLYGDFFRLVIHADRPTRSLEMMQLDPLLAVTSVADRQSIAWFLASADMPGLSAEAAAWFSQLSGDPRPVQGLARTQGMQAAMKQADELGDLAAIVSATRLIAPEVADVRFRYFDGLAWYTEWDTAAIEKLPNAVEITVMFRDADELQSLTAGIGVPRVHRHVVALPGAEPPVFTPGTEVLP